MPFPSDWRLSFWILACPCFLNTAAQGSSSLSSPVLLKQKFQQQAISHREFCPISRTLVYSHVRPNLLSSAVPTCMAALVANEPRRTLRPPACCSASKQTWLTCKGPKKSDNDYPVPIRPLCASPSPDPRTSLSCSVWQTCARFKLFVELNSIDQRRGVQTCSACIARS
ncbi:hypothetical protein T439DRAFT_322622 [Meredithblackwellia eburnea MCA 4105]